MYNGEHIRRQGFETQKFVSFRKFNRNTKAESLHFCPAFVYVLLAVVLFYSQLNYLKMEQPSELETKWLIIRNLEDFIENAKTLGIDYSDIFILKMDLEIKFDNENKDWRDAF